MCPEQPRLPYGVLLKIHMTKVNNATVLYIIYPSKALKNTYKQANCLHAAARISQFTFDSTFLFSFPSLYELACQNIHEKITIKYARHRMS